MSKQVAVLSAVVFLGFWSWRGEPVYGEAMQNFIQVAYIPDSVPGRYTVGCDTDHDGREELLLTGWHGALLYEHMGNNQYEPVLEVADCCSWAAGDIDSDGLADLVLQAFAGSLEVFESPAPDSHPSQCVWQWEAPYPMELVRTWITDLDQDGREEMLVSHAWDLVYIFENTGDNEYTQVFHDTVDTVPGAIAEMATGDFDSDGKQEFVTSNNQGTIFVYENMVVGVDSFAITWVDSLPIYNAFEVAATNDMDQDGKPEFLIAGDHNFAGGSKFIFTLFEATGDDDYEPVWADSSLTGSIFDYYLVGCGDVDGDSVDEMVFCLEGYGVCLYKCNGPDSYAKIWEWYTGQMITAISIHDLNGNGYGEIVVSTLTGTRIFEKELPGVNEMPDARYQMPVCLGRSRGEARLIQNVPNPFSHSTTITYALPDARYRMPDARLTTRDAGRTTLSVYDVTGQLVRVLVDQPSNYPTIQLSNQVVWDGRDSSDQQVASGVYFYCLKAGEFTATRKMTVLR